MYKSLILIGLVCFLKCLTGTSAADAQKVEMAGKLKTGIVAIGGETTGTSIETQDGVYELDLGKDKELRKTAEDLNGQSVRVTGTLEIRKGVEVRERKIVVVSKLERAKEK